LIIIIKKKIKNLNPSGAPLNLVLRPSADGTRLSLTWEPLPFEDRNGPDLYYSVNVSNTETSASYYTTSSTTSADFTSLHPDYIYECSVAAENKVGRGPHASDTVRMPEARKCRIFFSVTWNHYYLRKCVSKIT